MLNSDCQRLLHRCCRVAGVVAPLSFLICVPGCETAPPPSVAGDPPAVETLEAELITLTMESWPTIVRSQGSLHADEETVVGSKVAGRVAQVHVDLGDYVNTGEPLVTLDQAEFRLQVEQAQSQLQQARAAVGLREADSVEQLDPVNAPPVRQERALWDEAKSSLTRASQLQLQNAISQGEYDLTAAAERVAEARYASALNSVREKIAAIGVHQAELSLARQRLQDAAIGAPLDGFIRQRQAAPGTYLSVGQPIAVLVRTDPLRFRGTVPERHAQALAVGQSVRMKIESIAAPRTAKITRISPTLDQQTRSLTFEAVVPNPDHALRAGLFAEAEIVLDPKAQALVIPDSAVIEFAGAEKVWKVVDEMAAEQEVLVGPPRDNARRVLQGLKMGDVILRNASQGRVGRIEPLSGSYREQPLVSG